MSPINVENAVIRLYENEGLTDALDDQPAKLLLQWAESQISTMADRHDNEETFEETFKQLRFLVRAINRFAAQRDSMPPEEKQDYVQQRIIDRAQRMGFATALAAHDASLPAWLHEQDAGDQLACVQATIKLVEGGGSRPDDGASMAF